MPGPVITRTSLFPEWTKPENVSVFDPAYRAPIRSLISFFGLDDPQQAMMIGVPMELPLGGELGGLVGEVAKRFPRLMKAIKAYHGSPHDFEQFDFSKINTGQRAQSFGHGGYFAEAERTSEIYRDQLSEGLDSTVEGGGRLPNWVAAKVKHLREGAAKTGKALESSEKPAGASHSLDDLITEFKARIGERQERVASQAPQWWNDEGHIPGLREVLQGLENVKQGAAIHTPGKMYEVAIHADPEHFLNWDKPFNQQTPHVQDALIKVMKQKGFPVDEHGVPLWVQSNPSGESMHAAFSTIGKTQQEQQAAGAKLLKDAGIPGIKYLDQASRTAGEGTRNYVVFDDALIEIMRKYGWLLPVAGAGSQAIPTPLQK